METEKKVLRARSADDHLHEVAMEMDADRFKRTVDVDAIAFVNMSAVEMIAQHTAGNVFPYRPALAMTGEVQALTGNLADNVKGVAFPAGRGIPVRFVYDFDAKGLAELAAKGLFESGFDTPSLFLNTTFELPVKCTVDVLEPEHEDDVPVIFCEIQNKMSIPADAHTSGYTLADYFDSAVPTPGIEAPVTKNYEAEIEDVVTDEITSEFSEVEAQISEEIHQEAEKLDELQVEPLYEARVTETEKVADDIFARVLASMNESEPESKAEEEKAAPSLNNESYETYDLAGRTAADAPEVDEDHGDMEDEIGS